MNSAKFKATLVDFKVNGKKSVLKLELSNTDASQNFGFIVGSLDDDVLVQLGDPQVSMEELGVRTDQSRSGLLYNVEKDGTVGKVEGEQQGDIFDEPGDPGQEDGDQNDNLDADDFDFPDEDPAEDPDFDDGPHLEDEGFPDDVPSDDVEPKDEVEAFVLDSKAFGDEEYDWETLLRRKKAGETWMEIAGSLHITSSKLSTAWSAYKKRVKEYLAEEEHGAA